jgi:hypothetical protein
MGYESKVANGCGLNRYLVPAVKVMPTGPRLFFDANKELYTVVPCYLDIYIWY